MTEAEWWRGAVFYQIYPRSFMDSNGDGVGDLAGITDRLEYIAQLGIDAIWISPFFKSPMKDFGYDVSDYRDVDPIFGQNEDFDILISKAHRLGIKVIIDMVLSHTSDKHPWFVESRTSRDNVKADWYVWADPKPDGSPPNNWQSCFGGAAWTFDTRRGQYYLHNFLKEQPDLNYHCKDLQEAILGTCRYWLDRRVDGLRLDVINFLFCDKELRDNPERDLSKFSTGVQIETPYPYTMQAHVFDKSRPENLEFLKRLRGLMDEYPGTMTLGEIGDDDPYKLAHEYTADAKPLNTAYNTHMMSGNVGKHVTADVIRGPIEEFLKFDGGSWPSWAFTNHDVVRAVSRWGEKYETDPRFAKLLNTLLASLRGTIFMYQGEELGLTEADIPYDKIQDPWGKAMWPEWKGRDGCRTPMPWVSKGEHAGFSETEKATWLPIPENHKKSAVDKQEKDPNSVLSYTRRFLKWRKKQPVLLHGDIKFLDSDNDRLLVFERSYQGQTVLCAFNLGHTARSFEHNGKTITLEGFDAICADKPIGEI